MEHPPVSHAVTSARPKAVVGIDLAKRTLQVAVDSNGQVAFNVTFDYDTAGLASLRKRLADFEIELVVMEATGGLERRLAAELTDAGLTVAVVNPRQARSYADARGRLTKTDKIDALVLAEMARILRPEARPLPAPEQLRLKDLVARRRQLVHMRAQERNHAQQAASKEISRSIEAILKALDKQIEAVEKQIADFIDSNSDWKRKSEILSSTPGVGIQTAHNLLAELPELGQLNKRQVASLAGLAPHAFQSGQFCGQSRIWGGRAAVRTTLYMATMAALTWNPVIKKFYHALVARGKRGIVALVASMRKLLTILNALLRDRVEWNPVIVTDIG
jgi:transposase